MELKTFPACPLCNSQDVIDFHRDKFTSAIPGRIYLRCAICALIFVPPEYHLSPEDEKAEYDKHENNVFDPGYRKFLNKITTPLQERIKPDARGLDFGCGPGPALALIFREAGYRIDTFDVFYDPRPELLDPVQRMKYYDFITATEVFEHLARPARELERLLALLKDGGILGIMTKSALDPDDADSRDAFARWHYIRDPTHISFFSRQTFRRLAQELNLGLEFVEKDVIFFHK